MNIKHNQSYNSRMADDSNENDSKMTPQSEAVDDNQRWWLRFVPKAKEWSDVNISRFLSIYKTQSILWDPTHSFYTDESKRMKAYDVIAKRLNLYGVRERECIKLIESLKSLYAEEKKTQSVAIRCRQKYSPSPSWYSMLEEIVECVRRKLRESAEKVQVEPAKPWEACCPRLYTEDIWTPKHFKTNVTEWFLTSQDEQLFCTCKKSSETNIGDTSSTETSSTYSRDSASDSSSGIVQYVDQTSSLSSSACCYSVRSIKAPEQRSANVNNNGIRASCNDRKGMMKETILSIPQGKTPFSENTARCPSKNTKERNDRVVACCSEEIYCKDDQQASAEKICCGDRTDLNNNMFETDKKECKIQKKQTRKKISAEGCKKINNCEEELDIPEDTESVLLCGMTDVSVSEDTNRTESLSCGCEKKFDHRSLSQSTTSNSKSSEQSSKSCRVRTVRPCGPKKVPNSCITPNGNGGSITTSSNSSASNTSEFQDACSSLSDSHMTPITTSDSSSRSRKSLLSECASIPEKQESDHRLDHLPDPTLCEKCAVNRIPVQEAYANVVQSEDPRTPKLDKYCRYKDWDTIYNIRTQVPDDDSAKIQIDEDWLVSMRCADEPDERPIRQNHSLTEADVNLFINPKSSEARAVGLNDEYKWEYGMNIQTEQRRHYVCDVFQTPGFKPAQLTL